MTYKPFERDQKTAFNEVLIGEPTPVVQVQFPYNINNDIVESRENITGSVTQADNMAIVSSGAQANSAGHMLTRARLGYRPGQGALTRFTALYTTGVTGSVQLAGIGEVGDGLFFGYNGTSFGTLRRELGGPEIQTLTISAGAVTASGNITITLDGDDTLVAVTQNDTARQVAVIIADTDFSGAGSGWSADVDNATVIFRSWSAGNKSGSFAFADTDTTGVAASLAETVAGADTTNVWVPQEDWEVDPMDGSGPSGVIIDPTKGNVFQIRYQWLGFGQIEWSIEDPIKGTLIPVHAEAYANANTVPSLQNPTLPLHVMSKNMANTSDLTVKIGSMSAFVEGKTVDLGLLKTQSGDNAAVGTTELPILSIKNKIVYQSRENRVRVKPVFLSVAVEGTKPAIVRIRKNATLTGTPAFTDVDADHSVVSFDVASTGVSGGDPEATLILAKESSELVDLSKLIEDIVPGDILTVTAEATSGSGHQVTVSLTWEELF